MSHHLAPRSSWLLCLVLILVVGLPMTAPAAPDDAVKKAVENAVRYLRDIENGRGHFEHTTAALAQIRKGGVTALAVVALLKARVPANDPLVQRCLKYLRQLPPEQTYTVGLQTMAFCLAGQKEDRERIQRNLKWLEETRTAKGWGYDANIASPDHSINCYALLGIREAYRAGFKINREMLEPLRDHYAENKSGIWSYRSSPRPSVTMTSAGLVNLLATVEILDGKKTAAERNVEGLALKWLGEAFPADISKADFPHPFYCLHGIRLVGERTDQKRLGRHDWYAVGRKYLLDTQKANGSWQGTGGFDHWPPVATSLALLFLVGEK